MKRIIIGLLLAVFVVLLIPVSAVSLPDAETWENYTANDDSAYEVYGNIWYGQTFNITPESHSISGIRILAYREGYPSTVTISIRETESGLPTGQDITSGTLDGDAFTNSTSGVWYGFTLTETSFSYNETYAIIIRAEAGSVNHSIHVRYDGSSGTFAGGSEITSSNGGITWAADTDDDMLFINVGEPLLELTDAKVFTSYLEPDDMLIVGLYYNTYVPYYPLQNTPTYFWIQLRSTSGNTILAQSVCRAWGYRPTSVYLSAAQASILTVGNTYRVYIVGNCEGSPSHYYQLSGADWRGTDMTLLDSWVITTANEIGDYYDISTTADVGDAELLNEQGGVIFATGIPSLIDVRDDLFQVAVYEPDFPEQDWDDTFDTSTSWQAQMGDEFVSAMGNIGTIFGVEGQQIAAFGILILYLAVVFIIIGRGGDAIVAAILSVPFLLVATWLRIVPFALLASIIVVAVLLLVYRFWWSRT